MARTRTICFGLAAAVIALGGCATEQVAVSDSQHAALGAVPAEQEAYHLGAGDALGQEIFVYFVACMRAADEYYATGADDFPADN